MKQALRILLGCASLMALPSYAEPSPGAPPPVRIIFDTDMGNDVDDALALALLHALQNRGACELLAVTLTNPDPLAGAYIDAVNTAYGRGDIPIGISPQSPQVVRSKFLGVVNERDAAGLVFPHDFDVARAPNAVALLRRTLASAADASVVIVQVGFSTNLAALLGSKPDEVSELDGRTLVTRKVRLLSLMAGAFQTAGSDNYPTEFNIRHDVRAAQTLASEWPTPTVWSGVEIGIAVPLPASAIDTGYGYARRHLVRESYQLYQPTPHERPTWDLTSVLYAVYPERKYFSLSAPGRVSVAPDSFTRFTPAKKGETGRDRFLTLTTEQAARLKGVFEALCTEPPQSTVVKR